MIRARLPLAAATLLAAACLLPARGADTDSSPPGSAEGETGRCDAPRPYGLDTFRCDSGYLLSRPWRLDRRGWTKVGATFGIAAGLFAFRDGIRDYAQDHRTAGRDRLLQDVRGVMGTPGLAAALSLGAFAASFATHSDRERETAQLLLESLSYTVLVAGAGQLVLASERPRDGDAVRFFRSQGHGVSGDAAIAASIVAPLRRQYLAVAPEDGRGVRFLKRAGTGLLYSGAILTAWQRVASDAHWAPDAFLGLMTGFAVGEILCDAHAKGRESRVSLSIAPAPGGGASVLLRLNPGREPSRRGRRAAGGG